MSAASPARRVYTVFGVPPEIQAYAMAKYSRSSQSMLESIEELSQQRAEQFLNTFYFQYGHRSIADLAHLVIALEHISILAAIRVVDEPVWDGQERSTRYQDFSRSGYYVPPGLAEQPAQHAAFHETIGSLLAAYEQVAQEVFELLRATVPRPAEMGEGAYSRTLRARAFDVARALLPLAMHTSVGQIVSARVLERQISRLLADPYQEVRDIGQELRRACLRPAEAPLLRRTLRQRGLAEETLDELIARPTAPTLVKYVQADAYRQQATAALEEAARTFLQPLGEPDRRSAVELADAESLEDELVATLLYQADRAGHSYRQIQSRVRELSDAQKREIVDLSLVHRGKHDEWLRAHQTGYTLKFDLLVDLGAFRDLHRHRRCVQIQQPLTLAHGAVWAEEVFRAGLGEPAGQAGPAIRRYDEAIAAALARARDLARDRPLDAVYLAPLATRCRCLFKMDLAEVAYIAELRTQEAGHFSYRAVAWQMLEALRRVYPHFATSVRATSPEQPVNFLRR